MKLVSVSPFIVVSICALFLFRTRDARAQTSDSAKDNIEFTDQQLEFFENQVRPLLVEHCYSCHGPEAAPVEGGLSLQSRKAILAGGDTGSAISPGHPEKSLLIDAINYGEVYEMPPDTKLSKEDIATITQWVKQGAPWPKSTDVDVELASEFDLQGRKSQHWCWQPVRKTIEIPNVKNTGWPKDPIDNFILRDVEQSGLSPAPPADRRTLIRRAYFDIIGLPPTPEQIQTFVDDTSPTAFEKVVDELLASKRFGERWARHWMDLTRYAETGGHEFDYPIHYAFRYRDYLIRAFNEDVSYRQFIHEHVAGDLLSDPRRNPERDFDESVLGTGFWFLGEAKHAAVDSREEEARTIDNQIDVMSKTFLGLTVACARCHDHKFDAISTEDYYALAGFLQSSRRQAAMLDPGRKIEKSFNDASQLVKRADKLVSQLVAELRDADPDRIESYIGGAVEFLRADRAWNQAPAIVIEGESLKQASLTGGQVEIQNIKARDGFKLNGDKQNRWTQGKPNDHWVLGFELPAASNATRYNVSGVFTKAADYGAAQISINDNVVVERLDFYSPEQTTTGILALGEIDLKPGKNLLKFQLAEPHKSATPSNSVGLDYLHIVPVEERDDAKSATVQEIAARKPIDAELLQKLILAIQDPATEKTTHPLHLIFKASKSSQPVDAKFASEIESKSKSRLTKYEKWQQSSTVFADFENGLPAGWFETGFAFGGDGVKTGGDPKFASPGSILNSADTVHSGRLGTKFYGVLRSPAFELEHETIHYRIRGNNVTIRLIINGFTMDQFNALLYKGCKINIANTEEFVWQTQAGDLKNHLGSRAHIEIIDHGNGYFVIDEIRFSHGSKPADPPTTLSDTIVSSGKFDSQGGFCRSLATSLTARLKQMSDSSSVRIASWMIEKDLTPIFAGSKASTTSDLKSPRSSIQSVSLLTTKKATKTVSSAARIATELKSIRQQLGEINSKTPAPELAVAITDGTGEEERIFIRGNHRTLGNVATRRFLSAISNRPLNPPDGSGRLQLAQKITAPNNPLTTRVAVNRIWHHMLGRGIVESVDNFGVLGKTPTHPELLDYLASEFSVDQWSVKRMIKRIALTQTYQMSSKPNPAAVSIDPDNKLLHRAGIQRLQGEAIRDSILQISGRLDTKMYGPSVPVHLTSFMDGRGKPKSGPLDGAGRRSIYVAVRRNFLPPMMLAFDTPIPFNSIGKRNVSNVPAQALIMMNDPFVVEQAKLWAQQLVATEQSTAERIESIYVTAFGRAVSKEEREQAESFLRIQAKEYGVPENELVSNVEIWRDFCHVVFNLKEFMYIN